MEKDKDAVGVGGLTAICVAFTITLNNFAVGSGVFVDMSFWRGIITIVIAWVALTLVWTFSGLIGATTHKGATEIFRYSFGTITYRIPSLCMCLALIGFSIFDYWFVGEALSLMFPGLGNIGFYLGVLLGMICAVLGTIRNISSLKWLTTLTIPIALILFIIIMIATIIESGGMDVIMAYHPSQEMPIVTGVNILFSSFIAITAGFSDITCHATSKKAVYIAMPLCMLAIAFQYLVAQFGTYGLMIADFTSLALALGGPLFYIGEVFAIFAQANTIPGGTTIVSTQIHEGFHIPRMVMIFVHPILAAAGAIALFLGADISIITEFANALGCMFGPLLAIIFAEFYLVRRRKLPDDAVLPKVGLSGMITLVIGFGLGIYLTYFAPFSTPVAILLFVFCFLLHSFLRRVCHLR